MDGKSSKKFDQNALELYKLIIKNMHTRSKSKDYLTKIIEQWEKGPEYAVNAVMNDPEHRQIF